MRPTAIMLLAGCITGAIPRAGADAIPADAGRGRVIFNQCVVCHSTNPQDVPNPGPDLRGMIGRPAGSVPGFRYSRALRNARRSWTETALDAFIADPQAAVPGNTMPFPGIVEETQRRDLIAHLKTLK